MLVDVNFSESVALPIKATEPKEMLSVKYDGHFTRVKINSSSLGIMQECQRKSKYLLNEKWRGSYESPATLFGTAIHKALEVFYTGNPDHRKMPTLEQMELMSYGHKVEGEDSDLLLRATRAFVNKTELLKTLPETDKRSPQSGVWLLYNYFKTYINDPYVAYIDNAGPVVERKFSFILYADSSLMIEYFGTIDLVVKHIETGNILICDHKTSSIVGNDFYNRLKPNHQYTGYLMGASKVLNISTDSFLINCLQVKEKPKTARGTPPHLLRQVTTRDGADLIEFTETVVHYVKSYLRNEQNNEWPLGYVNGCASYGGCQFLSVCSAPSQMRETVLKNKFTKGE